MLGQTIASQGKKKGLSLYLRMDRGTRCNEVKEKKLISGRRISLRLRIALVWKKNYLVSLASRIRFGNM